MILTSIDKRYTSKQTQFGSTIEVPIDSTSNPDAIRAFLRLAIGRTGNNLYTHYENINTEKILSLRDKMSARKGSIYILRFKKAYLDSYYSRNLDIFHNYLNVGFRYSGGPSHNKYGRIFIPEFNIYSDVAAKILKKTVYNAVRTDNSRYAASGVYRSTCWKTDVRHLRNIYSENL